MPFKLHISIVRSGAVRHEPLVSAVQLQNCLREETEHTHRQKNNMQSSVSHLPSLQPNMLCHYPHPPTMTNSESILRSTDKLIPEARSEVVCSSLCNSGLKQHNYVTNNPITWIYSAHFAKRGNISSLILVIPAEAGGGHAVMCQALASPPGTGMGREAGQANRYAKC